mgnify:CR=1 FL=1
MAIPRAKKKKVIRSRTRTGVAAAPTDKGYGATKYYFHNEVDKKDYSSCVKTYVKGNYKKDDAKAIEANPEYKFTMYSHYACIAFWLNSGLEKTEEVVYWEESLKKHLDVLLEKGRGILTEKLLASKDSDKIISLTPQQRLANKISNTIMQDLMDLEDLWMNGEDGDIDLYSLFKKHGLAGSSVAPVRDIIEGWLLDYEDAYLKRCDQAVEGYSHLTKTKLKKRVNLCKEMLSDLDRIKSAARATRAVKVKQPRAADKQISKMKYKKEDPEFKLVSIPPVKIIGSVRLYAFNTKTRTLQEYVTESPKGFEVKGTTILNFDKVSSRSIKLRKPDEVLPIILTKSSTQIRKEWDKLKTKVKIPNGRINSDTILLRVMDK